MTLMQEAQARGIIIERNVESETHSIARGHGVSVQQYLIMPSDKGIPEITIKLWERVSERTTNVETD